MKSSFGFAALFAMVATVVVAEDVAACDADIPVVNKASLTTDSSAPVNMVPVLSDVNPSTNSTKLYIPVERPHFDRHNIKNVVPSKNTSCFYSANATSGSMVVNNTMKYPTVVLEDIASITNVDCTADSVAVTFNDTATFQRAQSVWASKSNASMVLITNHLGDCDVELERSYFIADSVSFDSKTLVATASTKAADISTVAAYTTISFGHIEAGVTNTTTSDKRGLVLDPKYTFNPSIALPEDTVLYSYDPYVTVMADNASLSADITFSGYLAYNWLMFKLDAFYFDIDAGFKADLGLSAAVKASYETSFTYAPASLYYGVSVPGILEIGPQLQFAIGTEIGVSAAAEITTAFEVAIAKGNIHLDVLDSNKISTSGWVPTYSAAADISGQVQAYLNLSASLTVEIAAKAFGGLIDLSTGLTATPGFDNSFVLTGGVGVGLGGIKNITNGVDCGQGLQLHSDFTFALDAFATQWYKGRIYEVEVGLVDKCYTWA